jgi:SAM-dependent methyltransferase
MDACGGLGFGDASFDGVLDKGTLDSVLCGENSTANAGKLCADVARVLKPGGTFILVSYGTPQDRLMHLENDDYRWKVTVHTVREWAARVRPLWHVAAGGGGPSTGRMQAADGCTAVPRSAQLTLRSPTPPTPTCAPLPPQPSPPSAPAGPMRQTPRLFITCM